MAEEEKKDPVKEISEKLEEAVGDFVQKVFGEKGKEVFDDAKAKAEELASSAAKSVLKLWDSVAESLKLKDNETVQKAREAVEDGLKNLGILKEEPDEEEF